MFDKKEYWKNRNAGKRGQGVAFNPKSKPDFSMALSSDKQPSKKALLNNTKRARKVQNNVT